MGVERQPVCHFVHGFSPGGKASAVEPADLQAPPQTLCCGGVVPPVHHAAHRGLHLAIHESLLEPVTAVLLGFKESSRPQHARPAGSQRPQR